jgi:hypothetical protein
MNNEKIIKILLTTLTLSVYATTTYAVYDCVDTEKIKLEKGADGIINVKVNDEGSNWVVSDVSLSIPHAATKHNTDTLTLINGGWVNNFDKMLCHYRSRGVFHGTFELKKIETLTILRVCNFYPDDVTLKAYVTGQEKYALTNNNIKLANDQCDYIRIKVPVGIPEGYIASTKLTLKYERLIYKNTGSIEGSIDVNKVMNDSASGMDISETLTITKIAKEPATNRDFLSVSTKSSYVPHSGNRFILHIDGNSTELQNIPNSYADFAICIGDKTNSRCNTYY